MKKAFITGISGFAGSFLAEELLKNSNFEVSGVYLSEASLNNLASIKDKIKIIKLDLTDSSSTFKYIKEIKPDYIFHLAGLAGSSDSFGAPLATIVGNVAPQINIFDAVRELNLLKTRILIASSAEIYGHVEKKDLPISEDTPLNPTSPYAVSKISQDFLGLSYFNSYNLDIVRVRPFNHIGPRQIDKFVVGSFAKKIAEIEKKKREAVMPVGNLESKRDFTDVRDVVKAYILALEKGKSGKAYNIGSGTSYSISEILDKLIGFSDIKIKVEQEKSLLRPSDNPDLICDYGKFADLTDWKPEIQIDKTLEDTLDYWRNII